MEDSVFTKIIKRELPAEILFEDDRVIVILDRFPAMPGQSLVITKEQIPYVFDLEDGTYTHLLEVAKSVAKALDRTFSAKRTCLVIEGFDVPHVHVRLYPITGGPVPLTNGDRASDEELKEVADRIRPHLQR